VAKSLPGPPAMQRSHALIWTLSVAGGVGAVSPSCSQNDGAGPPSQDAGAPDQKAPGDATPPTDSGDAGATRSIPTLHRPASVACGTQPRPDGSPSPLGCGGITNFREGGCARDEDCTTGSNGRCDCTSLGPINASTDECTYDQCASDQDCTGASPDVGVCVCRDAPLPGVDIANPIDPPNVCLGGNCKIDPDCRDGGYCSPSPVPHCGATWWYGYYCHTPADECTNDSDCTEGNAYCAYSIEVGHWICSTGLCIDG
jgi:hypothetical protein